MDAARFSVDIQVAEKRISPARLRTEQHPTRRGTIQGDPSVSNRGVEALA
jgi:hypothetical protein